MKSNPPQPSNTNDVHYIFILFSLIFVVIFFAFLIYFVYGQRQGQTPENSSLQSSQESLSVPSEEEKNLGKTQKELAPVETGVPASVVTPKPVSFDPARVNPRTDDTLKLRGRELIERYFTDIQGGDYASACSLLSMGICNARRDIYTFSQYLSKTTAGYDVKSITLAKEQKPNEAIFCIEYEYSLKADQNRKPITEFMQYRIQSRPDGADEISARVCEKVVKDGRERACPIITPKKYCN